jgi:large subunit ribosomal protein L17
MRHKKSHSLHNRFTSWRKATIVSIASNLLIYQSIRTTKKKAQSTQAYVERIISLAKSDTLAAKREIFRMIQDHKLVSYVCKELAPRFNGRVGGYTRILALDKRRGDDAQMVVFELTEIKKKEKQHAKKQKGAQEQVIDTSAESTPKEEKKPAHEAKTASADTEKEKPPMIKKPSKQFLGGLRNIFKKERDSL